MKYDGHRSLVVHQCLRHGRPDMTGCAKYDVHPMPPRNYEAKLLATRSFEAATIDLTLERSRRSSIEDIEVGVLCIGQKVGDIGERANGTGLAEFCAVERT